MVRAANRQAPTEWGQAEQSGLKADDPPARRNYSSLFGVLPRAGFLPMRWEERVLILLPVVTSAALSFWTKPDRCTVCRVKSTAPRTQRYS